MTALQTIPRSLSLAMLVVCSFALFPGCKPDVQLGSVTGKVTLDGKPLPYALAQFVPVAGGRSSLSSTNAEGEFVMKYSGAKAGSLVGQARVEITTTSADNDGGKEKVPKRYNTQSELVVDVQPGDNRFEWDLQSK